MRKTWFALSLCFLVAACGKEKTGKEPPPEEQPAEAPAQHPRGPNGGMLVVLGNNEGHLEVLANHMEGTVWIFTYDNEMVEVSVDSPPVLNFVSVDGPKQLTGEGGEWDWLFQDETLKKEFKQLRFRLTIGGKTYTPVWDHVH